MVMAMERFASSSTKCRRMWLLDYLGEPFDAANCQVKLRRCGGIKANSVFVLASSFSLLCVQIE